MLLPRGDRTPETGAYPEYLTVKLRPPPSLDARIALDAWMAIRGRQRALPHPRTGRATDFLFAIRGARIGDARIRRGLDAAAATAGLLDPNGETLRITPHQLRHTELNRWSCVSGRSVWCRRTLELIDGARTALRAGDALFDS